MQVHVEILSTDKISLRTCIFCTEAVTTLQYALSRKKRYQSGNGCNVPESWRFNESFYSNEAVHMFTKINTLNICTC